MQSHLLIPEDRQESQGKPPGETATPHHHSSAAVYMLRTTQQHHVQLSAMADTKANILIGASLVVVSICFGQMWRAGFSFTLAVWAIFCLGSASATVFAILPRSGKLRNTGNRPNPLFFGSFTQMDVDAYVQTMMEIMKSEESVLRAMIEDIYQLGQVLRLRKYKYLTLGYQIFMTGLLAAGVCAAFEFLPRLWTS